MGGLTRTRENLQAGHSWLTPSPPPPPPPPNPHTNTHRLLVDLIKETSWKRNCTSTG